MKAVNIICNLLLFFMVLITATSVMSIDIYICKSILTFINASSLIIMYKNINVIAI